MAAKPPPYDATEPVYSSDDKQDPNFVRVSIHIPGLNVKRKLTTKRKFLPSFVKEADNVTVDAQFEEMSFTLTVTGTGNLNRKCWALRIRQLPHPIVPEECKTEVKEDRVILQLRKLSQESWYPELEEGLDAYDEEEEAKKKKKKKKKGRTKSTESSGSRKINDESGEVEKAGEEDEEGGDESEEDDEEDSDEEDEEAEKSKSSDGKEKEAVASS